MLINDVSKAVWDGRLVCAACETKAVQAGETLPGIRTIESRISSHEPSAATMAPRPKPWESNVVVGAGSSAASEELDSKEASESESAQRPSSRRSVSPQLK